MKNILFYIYTLGFSKRQVPNIFRNSYLPSNCVGESQVKSEDFVIVLLKTLQCLPFALRPKAKLFTLSYREGPLCLAFATSEASGGTLPLLILLQHTGGLSVLRRFTCICASGSLYMLFLCLECCSSHFLCGWLLQLPCHLLREAFSDELIEMRFLKISFSQLSFSQCL